MDKDKKGDLTAEGRCAAVLFSCQRVPLDRIPPH
jgi:hypothetical protein